jgi:hypothetical protein
MSTDKELKEKIVGDYKTHTSDTDRLSAVGAF